MSTVVLTAQVTPAIPSVNTVAIYYDTADNHLKAIRDDGSIIDLWCGGWGCGGWGCTCAAVADCIALDPTVQSNLTVFLGTQVAKSIIQSGGLIQLDGDVLAPGVSMYYGTDAGGVKWFFPVGWGGGWGNLISDSTPATDRSVPVYNGLTGLHVVESPVLIDGAGNVSGINDIDIGGDVTIGGTTTFWTDIDRNGTTATGTINNVWVTENYDNTSVINNNGNDINNTNNTITNVGVTENYDAWSTITNNGTTNLNGTTNITNANITNLTIAWWVDVSVANKVFGDSPYTALSTDNTIRRDATGGDVVLNLPTAVGISGKSYVIRKIDASVNTVTIDAAGAEVIDGATTVILVGQWETVTLQSNGVSWDRLS